MLENLPRTLEWTGSSLKMIDQRRLPHELVMIDCTCSQDVCDAIAELAVRGAPAIGDAGAYALVLWVLNEHNADDPASFIAQMNQRAEYIANVRPTAVNLSWAVERVRSAVKETVAELAGLFGDSFIGCELLIFPAAQRAALAAANAIFQEDLESCRQIGLHGARELQALSEKLGRPLRVETHCNAGSLATAFYGTATSVIYHAYQQGIIEKVWVDETRPVDQGARLTAWELGQAGIPYTLICDNMAGSIMQAGKVDAVVVGADRVCANGDFANKIGTYPLAVLAQHHGVPFYTAAPLSTFDFSLEQGSQIVIEERNPQEVRCAPIAGGAWQPIAPEGCDVYNPAFDVTPHQLLAGIITEEGVKRF